MTKRGVILAQILITILCPLCLVLTAMETGTWIFALAAVVSVFLLIGLLPLYRGQEIVWIFLLIFITLTPLNIKLIAQTLSELRIFKDAWVITKVIRGIVWYMFSISAQEILCCWVARIIWRK